MDVLYKHDGFGFMGHFALFSDPQLDPSFQLISWKMHVIVYTDNSRAVRKCITTYGKWKKTKQKKPQRMLG